MRLLFGLFIPTILILAPLVLLLWVARRKPGISRADFGVAWLACFLAGLVAPIVATFLSARGLMYDFGQGAPKCVTGAAAFLIYGYLINLTGIPLAGIIYFPPKEQSKEPGKV